MRRIFLVEDDAAIARNLTRLLRSEDFAVTQASTQAEAFSILNEERFDLALVDVSLPDGNGFTVCTEIKETQDIPVIFLTAINDRANIEAVLKLNPAGYFLKPAVKDKLIAEIEKILNPASGAGQEE